MEGLRCRCVWDAEPTVEEIARRLWDHLAAEIPTAWCRWPSSSRPSSTARGRCGCPSSGADVDGPASSPSAPSTTSPRRAPRPGSSSSPTTASTSTRSSTPPGRSSPCPLADKERSAMVDDNGYAGIGSRAGRGQGDDRHRAARASTGGRRSPGSGPSVEAYSAAALDVAGDAAALDRRRARPRRRLLRRADAAPAVLPADAALPARRRGRRRRHRPAHRLRRDHAAGDRRRAGPRGAAARRHRVARRGRAARQPRRQPRRHARPVDERPLRVDAAPGRRDRGRRADLDPVLRQPRPGDRGGVHAVVRRRRRTRAATSRSPPATSCAAAIDGTIPLDDVRSP